MEPSRLPLHVLAALRSRDGQALVVAVTETHHVAADQVACRVKVLNAGVRRVKARGCTTGGASSPTAMFPDEQVGWMFHKVCMKEASTWVLPLEMDRCCDTDVNSLWFQSEPDPPRLGRAVCLAVTRFKLNITTDPPDLIIYFIPH